MMLQKLLSAAFIETGMVLFGAFLVYRSRRRKTVLEEFYRILLMMQARISYGSVSLQEIFEDEQKRCIGCFDDFYQSLLTGLQDKSSVKFDEIWKQTIEKENKNWFLTEEEKRELTEIGKYLGCMDRKEQLEYIRFYLEVLGLRIHELRIGQASYQKFVLSLSVLGGCMMIILIW